MIVQKHRFLKTITSLFLSLAIITGCTQGSDNIESNNSPDNEAVTTAASVSTEVEKATLMRDITSMELVKEMGVGWNLGDTLDVCQADRNGDGVIDEHVEDGEKVDETLWGNPKATKELFEALKEDGIKSVRIPITWRDHMDENYQVDAEWMDRVEEVVNYAYDIGLYVIINIHHDGGGDPQFGAWISNATSDKETTMNKFTTLWSQIAERFKDYSDYLIFESMNEVGFDNIAEDDAYVLLNEFNQTFVDLIRNSGGNNAERHLLISGYWTDIKMTVSPKFVMPTDPQNRCIVSVHYYTPWEFCTTNIQNEWGTDAEVQTMETLFGMLKTTFIDNNIPVIIGEYAASGNDLASCIFFLEKMVKICTDYGIATYLWDNGGQVNRTTYEWRTPQYLEAILRANSGEDYVVTKQA